MPEISYVTSLTDVIDIKKIEGGLEIGKLVDSYQIPTDKKELRRIKKYTLSKEMYLGNIISDDATIAVIIARLKENVDKIEVGRGMKKCVLNTKGNEKLYFAGIPFQMIFLTDIISSDILLLLPIVVILIFIVLAISFRSKRGVILPLATVIISTTWGLGLMSLLGVKLTIASDGMPILLLAIGSAYGIHLVNKYMEEIHEGDNKIEAVKKTICKVGIPIFLAGLTTAIGFLAFLTSNLTLIKEFGIFTAIGVLFAFIVSITFLPALISFMKIPKIVENQRSTQDTSINRFIKQFSVFIIKRKSIIVITGFLIFIVGILSVFNINREVNMVGYFEKDSEIRQAEEMMETKLGGSIPIQIVVKGDLKEPAVLKEIIKLEKYLSTLPDVHSPQSIADLICEMNDVMNNHYCIPDTREGVANLWFFLEGNEILPQMINSENNEGLIQAKLGTVNTKRMNFITDSITQYLSENIDSEILTINILEENTNQKKIIQLRLKNIIKNISYDAAHYGIGIKDTRNLSMVLKEYLSQSFSINWKVLKPNLADKLTDYLNDEESDLQIESVHIKKKLVKSITTSIEQSQNFTNKNIVSQLQKEVPVSYYEDDPELLDYAAISIVAIIKNEMKWFKANSLIKEITPLFSENLNEYSDFKKKLIGNIWEINNIKITIPYSFYERLNDKKQHQSPIIMNFQQTGLPIIYKDIDSKIISSQAFSLIFALGLVLILLTIQFKSYIGGLISILPIILTVLFNFIIMWIFKIPLDAVSVMIGSVAVGIGIDYTIHFNSRFNFEVAFRNESAEDALNTTLQTTGKAIIINASSVMFGFLTLLFGSIVPMQRFGWLIALTMVISALSAIIFLPSLILLTHASFLGDLKHNALKNINGIKSGIKKRLKNLSKK
jgi:predicted RND superfamily exporter protein